jgi:hypothetical protein
MLDDVARPLRAGLDVGKRAIAVGRHERALPQDLPNFVDAVKQVGLILYFDAFSECLTFGTHQRCRLWAASTQKSKRSSRPSYRTLQSAKSRHADVGAITVKNTVSQANTPTAPHSDTEWMRRADTRFRSRA